uniref:Uncharacterized protein n=1 Tax=Sinorhizobium meliloti (strain SM11) TaxID=707241 RepID=Q1WLG7_SINMM|nr:hypothetical protein [Sinorhizobium meliloti]
MLTMLPAPKRRHRPRLYRIAARPYAADVHRVAVKLTPQGDQIDEAIRLPSKVVRDHRRLREHGRDDRRLSTFSLQGSDERPSRAAFADGRRLFARAST